MAEIDPTKSEAKLANLVDRAVQNKERVRIGIEGNEVAAVIPVEDLELLERLEDQLDLLETFEALHEASEEGGFLPWDEFRKQLSD